MTLDIPMFIFISVILIGFGYTAGSARNFNFWKMFLLGMILFSLFITLNLSKAHLITMFGAFLLGYFLPYANLLGFIGEGLSDLINSVRYRSAYEDIKRKEEEVEALRRKYEQAQKSENRQKQEQEYERRKHQSRNYREQQKQESEQKSQSSKSSGSSSQSSSSSIKSRYLEILGLDPNKNYSYEDIKKAYRRAANKWHPDKHQSKGAEVVREMNERFKVIKEAFEWLSLNNTI